MEKNIKLVSYRINKLGFTFHDSIKPGAKFQIKPKIECKLGRKDNTLFVNLSVRINEDISSPVPFDLDASLFAVFNTVNEKDQNEYVAEAMDCLYPIMRAAIASITASCNIPAYVLPFIDSAANETKQGNTTLN
ncbi:MAG: protein-export chaperone SecB [Clostridia bacterium]|nr:protein-export chaperone SecB [Clostridia bacterium]